MSSRGDCGGADWVIGGVGVIPGGKGAAIGVKGLARGASNLISRLFGRSALRNAAEFGFRHGEDFEATIRAGAGNVNIIAETSIPGRAVTLDNIAIFGERGELVNLVGASQFRALRTQVAQQAADAGLIRFASLASDHCKVHRRIQVI